MKTAESRSCLMFVYAILLLGFLAFGQHVHAAEGPAKPSESSPAPIPAPIPAQPPGAVTPALPPTGTPAIPAAPLPAEHASRHPIPNQRELNSDDYAWLGRIVWDQLQQTIDPQKRDLSEGEIRAKILEMEKNRREILLTLDDLYVLMKSPALCGGAQPVTIPTVAVPRGSAGGIDLGFPGRSLRETFQ